MTVFLISITFIAIMIALYCAISKKKNDDAVEKQNKQLYNLNNTLRDDNLQLKVLNDKLKDEQTSLSNENLILETNISRERERLKEIQDDAKNSLDNQMEISNKAYENYWNVLNENYIKTEKEYDGMIDTLKHSYSDLQHKLIKETEQYQSELDKIKATRIAIIDAERREKEIENNLSFYCLDISDADKADIARLEALKPSLNKPRVLSMLIWQTWFQKPLKALSANVIGTTDKTGIYKITNIKTKECYIGQAASVKDRWTEHAKCGLGIDTPAGNKLYKAMSEYGLWNFSFELLEECPREQLNEKEKYYIGLYSAYDYGYNSTRGNR